MENEEKPYRGSDFIQQEINEVREEIRKIKEQNKRQLRLLVTTIIIVILLLFLFKEPITKFIETYL